jgi:hypothetical protein
MAEVWIWVFRVIVPSFPTMVLQGTYHATVQVVRLGGWDPNPFEDFRLGLYLIVSGLNDRADERYYAISCAMLLSLLNWVLVGLFDDQLDLFYLQSWQVFLTCE